MTGRSAMRSPGRPPVWRREHQRRFWDLIARGVSSEEAGLRCGVSAPVGTRWFREAGGMRPVSSTPVSGRYLSFVEREEIALMRARESGVREIGRVLGRSPSTISRELRRNAATRGGRIDYRAANAQWHADRRASRPEATLATTERRRQYVRERLDGTITRRDGHPAAAPDTTAWKGRRHGRRQDRRWATAWSRNRSPTDWRSSLRMMSRCGSHMRPSTKRSTFRAVARCGAS